jgi:hypothetical protein
MSGNEILSGHANSHNLSTEAAVTEVALVGVFVRRIEALILSELVQHNAWVALHTTALLSWLRPGFDHSATTRSQQCMKWSTLMASWSAIKLFILQTRPQR